MTKHLIRLFQNKWHWASAAFAAACVAALPSAAHADVCGKIDYRFASKVYDQVLLYTSNSYVYARDAACILKNVPFSSEQEKIGIYLSARLSDPENIKLMLDEVKMPSSREKITQAAIQNNNRRRPAPPPPPPPPPPDAYHSRHHHHAHPGLPPPPPRIHIAHRVNEKIDYTFPAKIKEQLQLQLGSSYIYASDAAAVLKKIDFPNYQQEIGAFLCPKIADRENINLLINAPEFPHVRDALTHACLGK